MTPTEFETLVDEQLVAIGDMLKSKNRAYGNSALDPVRVFSKADTAEQIRVRLDDKLSRLARGAAAGEDVVFDLLGYLVLLRIAERPEPGAPTPAVKPWPDLPPVTGMEPPRPVPAWVLPFITRPGHYAHAEGRTVGPKDSDVAALELLASELGWGAGEHHAYQEFEVPARA